MSAVNQLIAATIPEEIKNPKKGEIGRTRFEKLAHMREQLAEMGKTFDDDCILTSCSDLFLHPVSPPPLSSSKCLGGHSNPEMSIN